MRIAKKVSVVARQWSNWSISGPEILWPGLSNSFLHPAGSLAL